jgi:hypothetical protein
MLNIKEGDSVIPKGAVYGGEVMAVNHVQRTITFKAGNSELAQWHTLPYKQLMRIIIVNHQTQQVPIIDEEQYHV